MRSLSSVIKNCRVEYIETPHVIKSVINRKTVEKEKSIADILKSNAQEAADISLKNAVARSKEIKEKARVEEQIALAASHKLGKARGYADGFAKSENKGRFSAQNKVREASQELIACFERYDSDFEKKLRSVRNEKIDIAFTLAEHILGMQINRDDDEFKELINKFMKIEHQLVHIEIDGDGYELKAVDSQGLISGADGLDGISVTVNDSADEAETKTFEEQQAFEEAAPTACYNTSNENETNEESEPQIIKENEEAVSLKPQEDAFEEAAETFNNKSENKLQNEVIEENEPRVIENETDSIKPQADEAKHIVEPYELPDFGEEEPESEQQMPAEASETVKEDIVPAEDSQESDPAFPENNEETLYETKGDYPEEPQDNNYTIPNEKLVYVRPSLRSAAAKDAEGNRVYTFEDIANLDNTALKALTKKASINDLAAALQGAPQAVTSAILNAGTRRVREKVLDGIKYLGPAEESETLEARERLVRLAADIAESRKE